MSPKTTLVLAREAADAGNSTITEDWFGSVQTGFNTFAGYRDQFDALGATGVRWPGGTLSETQTDVYSLTNPDIFDGRHLYTYDANRDRPGLTEMLAHSVENDLPFTMILPTARYAGDPAAGQADTRAFLVKLLEGGFGALPDDFTLEIGNEYAALAPFADAPGRYGRVANALIEEIIEVLGDRALNPSVRDFGIAVQLGHSDGDDRAIREEMSGTALEAIDTVVFHSLPINLRNFRRGDGETSIDRYEAFVEAWQAAKNRAGPNVDLDTFVTAWTVGLATSRPLEEDLNFQDYGARSASTMLEMFAAFSSVGVDAAASWGIDIRNANSFSKMEGGRIVTSHSGEMFRLLSGRLTGMTYLGEYAETGRDAPFAAHVFGGDERVEIFVAANDIDPDGADLHLSLQGFGEFEVASVTRLGTDYADGYRPTGDAVDRLHETPVVGRAGHARSGDGIDLRVTGDYEVLAITLDTAPQTGRAPIATSARGSGADETLIGSGLDDRIAGRGGDDTVRGAAGDDTLHGGAGDDRLAGDAGDDRLYGEEGADRLTGGAGDDVLMGGSGDDRLDGGRGDDRLHGHSGRDVLTYDGGRDVLDGGGGDDTVRIAARDTFERGIMAENVSSDVQRGTGEMVDVAGLARSHAVIRGNVGHDTLTLGPGDDALFLHDALSDFHGTLGLDRDASGRQSAARLSGIEEILGFGGDDVIDLTSTDYSLRGAALTLSGGRGDDTIWGADSDDRIFGGPGDDVLFGGAGQNTLIGGAGADTFQFAANAGATTLFNFSARDGDRLAFYAADGFVFDRSSLELSGRTLGLAFTETGGGETGTLTVRLFGQDGDGAASLAQISDSIDFL